MKQTKYIILAIAAIVAIIFQSCHDDNLNNRTDNEATTIELGRINGYHEIQVTGGQSWTVAECPDWVGISQKSGAANEAINMFVDTNIEDDDRSANLVVSLHDGSKVEYTLRQLGLVNDPDNGEITDYKFLTSTAGVGYSINVFNVTDFGKYSFTSSALNLENLLKKLKDAGETDAVTEESRYYSKTESVSGNSTSALSSQLSINAGIEVGVSGFKASVDGGFKKNQSSTETYAYAIQEIMHIVKMRQMRAGMLRYFAEQGNTDILQSGLIKCVEQFSNAKDETSRKRIMKRIFTYYGTHVIVRGTLGGELKLSMKTKTTETSADKDINAALNLTSKVINVKGDFEMTQKEKSISSNTEIALNTYGGTNVYTLMPGTTFDQFLSQVKSYKNLDKWVSTIKNGQNLALLDVELIPVYELMPTQEMRDMMRNYMVGEYQKEMLQQNGENPDYTGPDLYVLKNFNLGTKTTAESTVYIPEINTEIVAYHGIISELSKDEYSTVIYSGEKGKVDKTRGFFIGSATRQPCKFTVKDGVYTTEVFDKLNKAALQQLYVDATGDITIFPKGATDMYRDVVFDWTIDLNKCSDWTITNNCTITGKTDNRISIEPDLTVRFNSINVAGIDCKGTATLINDGENYLTNKDSSLSGIYVAEGKTLTIKGAGQVNIDSNGAGIGCHKGQPCGNIRIESSDICIGASGGACIGTLGSAYPNTKCGNIFISKNIKQLILLRASSNILNHIGKGCENSSCGDIDIENGANITYWENISVEKGPKSRLAK